MACYLCAYKSLKRPERPRRLPDDSPIISTLASLGTCVRCGVHACSEHASRPSKFECAICRPATTILTGVGIDGDSPDAVAAFESSRRLGENASSTQLQNVERALNEVLAAAASSEALAAPAGFAEEASAGGPNLVTELASVVRRRMRDEQRRRAIFEEGDAAGIEAGLVFEVQSEGREPLTDGVVSIDAIGAAVAATFEGQELRPRAEAVPAVTGALLAAMATANDDTQTIVLGDGPERVAEVEVRPPWEVSHPLLLDPLVWLLATAYTAE